MLWLGVLLAVCGGIGWTGFGYAMGKAPKQGVNVSLLLLFYNFFVVAAGMCIGAGIGCPDFANTAVWLFLLSAVIGGVCNYAQLELMSRAMQCGPNGIIWSICQAGFVFPFCMGVLFFHVPLNPVRVLGIGMILLALALLGGGRKREQNYGKWRAPAFCAFLATGFCQSFANLPSYFPAGNSIPGIWRMLCCSAGLGMGALVFMLCRKRLHAAETGRAFCSRAMLGYIVVLVILALCNGNFFIYPSMDILAKAGAGAIAYPIMVASCLAAFELYSILVLHEKRSAGQIAGTILCIAGAAAITR